MENSPRIERIKKTKDYRNVMRSGRRVQVCDWLILFIKKDSRITQIGWTVPGYVGTAVTRNKLKRWLKEIIKNNEKEFSLADVNCAINFYFQKMKKEFYKELKRSEFDKVIIKGFRYVVHKPTA